MNVLDLFSGIGGFSLALESTGFFKTIAFVEKDKFCQKVLQKNFPNIPIEDDVRNVKGEKYRADVITGGFPCQPFSVAGKRRGTDDDRFLWDETIRIVSETKCKWFIGENVEGIINIQDGMVFRQIHDDLESEGFETQSLIIPASGKGAWHQRKRVWIIGCNVSNTNPRFSIGENEKIFTRGNTFDNGSSSDVSNTNDIRSVRVQEPEEEIIGGSKATSNSSSSHDVSNTQRNKHQHSTIKQSRENKIWRFHTAEKKQATHDIRSKTSRCNGISGKTQSWWETQSKLCGVPNGVSATMDKDRANRIKSLGNSIVPQIAREIGLGIMEAEIG